MSMNPPPRMLERCRGPPPKFIHPRPRASSIASSPIAHLLPLSQNQPIYFNTTAMDRLPRLFPQPVVIPMNSGVAPKRNYPPRQDTPHRQYQLSQLRSADQLREAVLSDPQGMYVQLMELVNENHKLRMQVTSITEDLEGTHKDYESKRKLYDQIIEVGRCKLMVMWSHIERLQGGLFDGAGFSGSKERFDRRELEKQPKPDIIYEDEGKTSRSGSVRSPRKEPSHPQGNESPGTVASVTSDVVSEGFGSPTRSHTRSPTKSVAGSTTVPLNPSAMDFMPRNPAPLTYYSETSDTHLKARNDIGRPRETSTSSTVSQTNVMDPYKADPISDADMNLHISMLPLKYQRACPFHLSYNIECPRSDCNLQPLCFRFRSFDECKVQDCRFAHGKVVCIDHLLGRDCGYRQREKTDKIRKVHMTSYMHKEDFEPEEWAIRMRVAALATAHAAGRC